MAAPSVAVIGGGIIGCATAGDLAKRGCRVTLLERASPGAEASSAAAGLLAPLGPSPEPGPFHRLAIESWRLYPRVASELRDLTGVDIEHMTAGTLYPLHSPREIEAAEGSDLRALEPALSKDVSAALLIRGDHWVNNQRLVIAYAAAAAARGVAVRTGAEVSRILIESGRARGVLVDGEAIHADAVLLAAGAWSGALADAIGLRLPVAPVRGQMLAVSNVPPLITRAVHGDDIYVVPRPSGEVLIGATVEHAGFVRAVTPDGLGSLIAAAVALVPEIGRRPVTRSWCGFRPWVPDGQPVLGPWPDIAGLFAATAHYRNGILMAPITAALMTRCIVDGDTPASITSFLPGRFAPGRQHAPMSPAGGEEAKPQSGVKDQ